MAFPSLIAEISVLVPPTSKNMPSETLANINAAAIPAAGSESRVRIGRRRICGKSITPPSLRIIISGTLMPLFFMLSSVISAVEVIFDKMLAFITAMRVLTFKPYS